MARTGWVPEVDAGRETNPAGNVEEVQRRVCSVEYSGKDGDCEGGMT